MKWYCFVNGVVYTEDQLRILLLDEVAVIYQQQKAA